MATVRTRAYFQALFITGYKPTQTDYADLYASIPYFISVNFPPTVLIDGATVTWDYSLTSNVQVTLGGNRTLAITNLIAGDYGTIKVIQSAGSNTLALPAGSKVQNGGAGIATLTTTAAAIDILCFYYDGTNLFWNVGLNYT